MPYKPLSGNDRVIPQTLQGNRKRLASLESLTSGQINSQLYALQQRAEVVSDRATVSGWTVSNNQALETIVSGTIEIPPGKATAHIFVNAWGTEYYSMPNFADARLTVGSYSRRIAMTYPLGSSAGGIMGALSRTVDVTGVNTLAVSLDVAIMRSGGSPTQSNQAFLDWFVAYTT